MTSGLFFKLPRELRDTIYDYAFTEQAYQSIENGLIVYYSYKVHGGVIYWCDTPAVPLWITTCKQIYSEALDQFYRVAVCHHFHLTNARARLINFSPFTLTRATHFAFRYNLDVWSSRHQHEPGLLKAFIGIDTEDRFESMFLDDLEERQRGSDDDDDDEHEDQERCDSNSDKLEDSWHSKNETTPPVEEEQASPVDSGKQEKKPHDQDAEDEACRRFMEALKRRKKDDVIDLELELEFPDNTADHKLGDLEHIEEWELRFSFLEAFGTCLQSVQFSVGTSCMWPLDWAVLKRHVVLMLLQREFETIGKTLVSGGKRGWVLTGGSEGSLRVERSESGENSGVIEYRGLEGFVDDAGVHYWYSRLPDTDDGKVRWECKEGGAVVVDALAIPDKVVRALGDDQINSNNS